MHLDMGVSYTKGLLITGIVDSNNNLNASVPDLGRGCRLMFYPGRAAFRAGYVDSNQWNNSNVGLYSFAVGYKSKASGNGCSAMGASIANGYQTTAIGNSTSNASFSTAMGQSTANGGSSTAMGQSTANGSFSTATGVSSAGDYSTAMGISIASDYSTAMGISISNGHASTAMGYSNALGYISTAMGQSEANESHSTAMGFSKANGQYSTAVGNSTTNGDFSTAMGQSTANGPYSTATGHSCISKGHASTVIGNYNDSLLFASETTITSTTPLFIVGNGDDHYTRSNALTVVKNGKVYIDPSNKNTGNLANALLFGGYNTSGEGISSQRLPGGTTNNVNGLDFYTNAIQRMSITNGGNLGINTNAPIEKLSVLSGDNTNTTNISAYYSNNLTQGIGIGYDQIRKVGSDANGNLTINAKGNGNLILQNTATGFVSVGSQMQVATNLTVQSGKGIIRNTDGTQSKKLSSAVLVNLPSLGPLSTQTVSVTWPEAFSLTPEAYVGNVISGAGGWGEVIMSLASVTTTGATLFVSNPRTTAQAPNFTVKIIAIGAQ